MEPEVLWFLGFLSLCIISMVIVDRYHPKKQVQDEDDLEENIVEFIPPQLPRKEPELGYPELVKMFKTEVRDREDQVDPGMTQDWMSLSIGWGLGKGLSPESAHVFAAYLVHIAKLVE